MKKLVCVAFLVVVVALAGRLTAEDKGKDGGRPKYDIKTIMEKAHKGGAKSLRARVLAGKATREELNQLAELYIELGKGTPPRGTRDAWRKKTETVIAAVQKVKADPTNVVARKTLANATKCAACHEEFKKDDE